MKCCHIDHNYARAYRHAHMCAVHAHSFNQNGNTALIVAAEEGRADCLRLLMDSGADVEASDNVRAESSRRNLLHGGVICNAVVLIC
jgi:anti-sigma regulatory factor (Ser/Thr protein kinase)